MHPGWEMEIKGSEITAITNHTGLLVVREEEKPRIKADPHVLERAIRANLENYLEAIQERFEPMVNHLGGLASIVLNKAVLESIDTEVVVQL